jgi:hypothetical protein
LRRTLDEQALIIAQPDVELARPCLLDGDGMDRHHAAP